MERDRIRTVRADSVEPDNIRDCLNEAFSDYLIRMPSLDAEGWRGFLTRQSVDLSISRVGLREDRVEAFALVMVRGNASWRIAVMGARPDLRGTGLAPRLLDETLDDARSRGLPSVELEVFAQNERAFRLYVSRGMKPVSSLFGYEAVAGSPGFDVPVQSVTLDQARLRAEEIEHASALPLPWQVGPAAISRLPGTAQCWQHGSGQVVFSEVTGLIHIHSLLDSAADYRCAAKLLGALRAAFPEAMLRAPPLQAEHGAAQAFRSAQWTEAALFQYLMVIRL
jgi:ribosomal protein S18 acetylase RimI-like enzyme